MCLAVPGKVIERRDDAAVVDIDGNRLRINAVLTPDAREGTWVLVHAGFAITEIEERAALETWDYLHTARDLTFMEDAGFPGEIPANGPTERSECKAPASARTSDSRMVEASPGRALGGVSRSELPLRAANGGRR